MNPLICIVGVDGTGKTTQAKKLLITLRDHNIPSKYVWLRFFHFFSLPVLLIIKLFKLSYTIKTPSGNKIGYHELWKNPLISAMYQTTILIDIYLYKIYKIDIPQKIFSKTIVCDRFIFDTIVDLMISTRNNNFHKSFTGILLLGMVPKNTIVFYLSTGYEVLINRRDDIKGDLNLIDRIKYYDQISNLFRFTRIDAADSEVDIAEIIVKGLRNEQIL